MNGTAEQRAGFELLNLDTSHSGAPFRPTKLVLVMKGELQ
jgi:hypothetical protein